MSRSRSTGQPHLTHDLEPLGISSPFDDPNPITPQIRHIHEPVLALERLMRMRCLLTLLVRSGTRVGKLELEERRVRREKGRGQGCECAGGDGRETAGFRIDGVVDGGSAAVLRESADVMRGP